MLLAVPDARINHQNAVTFQLENIKTRLLIKFSFWEWAKRCQEALQSLSLKPSTFLKKQKLMSQAAVIGAKAIAVLQALPTPGLCGLALAVPREMWWCPLPGAAFDAGEWQVHCGLFVPSSVLLARTKPAMETKPGRCPRKPGGAIRKCKYECKFLHCLHPGATSQCPCLWAPGGEWGTGLGVVLMAVGHLGLFSPFLKSSSASWGKNGAFQQLGAVTHR